MKPLLFEIPVPQFALPLGLTLSVIAGLALVFAVVAHRRKSTDVRLCAIAISLIAAVAAALHRGEHFVPAPIPIMSYGTLLAISLFVGWVLSVKLAEQAGLFCASFAQVFVVAVIAGFAGARVQYVLSNLHDFQGLADALSFGGGGFVAYGGFLGGFAGSVWALRRLGLPFFRWADLVAPSAIFGVALTRLGCYLYGCDYGRQLSSTAPVWLRTLGTFPRWNDSRVGAGSPAWVDHVLHSGLSPSSPTSLPVHPTELYEAGLGLCLFAISWIWFSRRRFSGELFLSLAMAYGAMRFVVEIFRGDLDRGFWGPHVSGVAAAAFGATVVVASLLLGPLMLEWRGRSRGGRAIVFVAAVVCVALATLLARLTAFGHDSAALSVSQWLGLATCCSASIVYGRRLIASAIQLPKRGNSN